MIDVLNWIAAHGWMTFWIVLGLVYFIDEVCDSVAKIVRATKGQAK